jgi:RNA polymerase sigma factor (sigma-70 family)
MENREDSTKQGARGSVSMTSGGALRALLEQVRAGDQQAAAELVRRYEPTLLRAIRLRLRDRQLRRALDSTDICQGVFLRFFVRVATGAHGLDTPEQLLKLLATMARNQVVNEALHEQAARRDCRRRVQVEAEEHKAAARDSTPSAHVAAKELVEKARHLLGPDDWQLLELRKEGMEWADLARLLGATAEGLRKRVARAVARVTEALDLVEAGHA